MSLAAKELLTKWHEIHFVSTQLGTSVIQHLLLSISPTFSSSASEEVLKVATIKAHTLLFNIWKLNLTVITTFIINA